MLLWIKTTYEWMHICALRGTYSSYMLMWLKNTMDDIQLTKKPTWDVMHMSQEAFIHMIWRWKYDILF